MTFPFPKTSHPQTINRKILRATGTVAVFAVVARMVAVVKELIVARAFGRSDSLDAFLVAFALPSFMTMLVIGAVGAAVVPVLIETRHQQGASAADKLLSATLLISTVALIAAAVIMCVLAPVYLPFLAHGFSPEKLALTRTLLYLLAPWLVFSGVAAFLAAILNAGERFAVPTLSTAATPLVTLLLVVYLARSWGPFALVAGMTAGSCLEAGVLFCLLAKQGNRFHRDWKAVAPQIATVWKQAAPVLGGSFLMGGTLVIDQGMAAMLPGGSVAALVYANRLVAGIVAISATALSTAVLPYMSRMTSAHDWQGIRHTLKRYVTLVLVATVPTTVLLVFFSHAVVKLLYQRGAFTAHDTDFVASVLRCYALQIPCYMLSILFVRFLSAIKRNGVLLFTSLFNLIVDITLNLLFMRIWGVAGIALSTSCVYLVSLIMVMTWSRHILANESSALRVVQAQIADS